MGYDLTTEIPHLIVKNGWSKKWGEGGYYKIALGKTVSKESKGYCRMFDH